MFFDQWDSKAVTIRLVAVPANKSPVINPPLEKGLLVTHKQAHHAFEIIQGAVKYFQGKGKNDLDRFTVKIDTETTRWGVYYRKKDGVDEKFLNVQLPFNFVTKFNWRFDVSTECQISLNDEDTVVVDIQGSVFTIKRVLEEGNKNYVYFVDQAMLGKTESPQDVGGIDFNPAELNIQEQGNDIKISVPAIDLNALENMNINGFTPIIIQVVPITNLPALLGSHPSDTIASPELSLAK